MARLAKRLAMLAVAGTLTATSLTGCGTINTDETVATVGDEKITLGVANFTQDCSRLSMKPTMRV